MIYYLGMRNRSGSLEDLSCPTDAAHEKYVGYTEVVWMHGVPWEILDKNGREVSSMFPTLEGNITFECTGECQKTFDKVKEYLSQPSLLDSHIKGETLFMYLVVTVAVASTVI